MGGSDPDYKAFAEGVLDAAAQGPYGLISSIGYLAYIHGIPKKEKS